MLPSRRRERTGGVWNAEYRVVHPPNHPHAGETRWVAVEGSIVLRCPRHVPRGCLASLATSLQRKQAEQALAERNMQLALAGKSGRVGSFAYDIDTRDDANLCGLRGDSRLP